MVRWSETVICTWGVQDFVACNWVVVCPIICFYILYACSQTLLIPDNEICMTSVKAQFDPNAVPALRNIPVLQLWAVSLAFQFGLRNPCIPSLYRHIQTHKFLSCRCCRREADGQVLGEVTQHAQAKQCRLHMHTPPFAILLWTGLWLWNMCFSPAFQFAMLASLDMTCIWTIGKHWRS